MGYTLVYFGVLGASPDQKAGRLAFCDTKCVSGETDGKFTGTIGFGGMGRIAISFQAGGIPANPLFYNPKQCRACIKRIRPDGRYCWCSNCQSVSSSFLPYVTVCFCSALFLAIFHLTVFPDGHNLPPLYHL